MTDQATRATAFRNLHHAEQPLVLPNAWDPLSAALVAEAGFPAVATASAAIALSQGYDDGERVPFDTVVDLVSRITDVLRVPLTVDFERGFGSSESAVYENTLRLIEAGAVGVNIEDSQRNGDLRAIPSQVERITAVRRAGNDVSVPIFINARTDAFAGMLETTSVGEAVKRSVAYRDAGADGIYPILCEDLDALAAIGAACGLPLNVLNRPSLPPLDRLTEVGVSRISLGPGLLSVAAGAAREAIQRIAGGDRTLSDMPTVSTTEMRRLLGL